MKTRLTRHTTGTVFHRIFSKEKRKLFLWGMNLKSGDIINSFDGFNHKVQRIELEWKPVSKSAKTIRLISSKDERKLSCHNFCDSKHHYLRSMNGSFVSDVLIYTTNGYVHHLYWDNVEPGYDRTKLIQRFSEEDFKYMSSVGILDENGVKLRSPTEEESNKINHLIVWDHT